MNDGAAWVAPFAVANATWGVTAGLVPPTAGCIWQPPQLPRFIVGPRPSLTSSSSWNSSRPAWKNASSALVSPEMGAPAPGAPPRTSGSRAAGDESTADGISEQGQNHPTTTSAKSSGMTKFFIVDP